MNMTLLAQLFQSAQRSKAVRIRLFRESVVLNYAERAFRLYISECPLKVLKS